MFFNHQSQQWNEQCFGNEGKTINSIENGTRKNLLVI